MTINKLLAAAVMSLATIGTANATALSLDSFDYSLNVDVNVLDPKFSDSQQINNINPFGGDVKYDLVYNSGTISATAATFAGDLVYSNGGTVISELTITYGQFDGFGVPALDFTGFSAFYFDIVSVDLGFDFEVTLTDESNNTATYMDTTAQINSSTTNFVSFANFAGVDLSAIEEVELVFSAAINPDTQSPYTALDLVLSDFGVVPEPTTLAVFGLGLLGLGAARRRKA